MSSLFTSFGQLKLDSSRQDGVNQSMLVRVADVILSEEHPEYEKLGGVNSIGAIKYTKVASPSYHTDTEELPYALPISATIRTLPLKNEIVILVQGPSTLSSNTKAGSQETYYTTIVSVWAHPTHNASVDATNNDISIGDFPEVSNINPLQPFPGDVLVEGRLGQSIRLSGADHNSNPWSDDSNNGKPFMILSNGQKEVGNGLDHIIEDINEDNSSIYLTSDHLVELKQSRDKVKSFKVKPIQADSYKGEQVLINSGRLYFNSKKESILFSAKEAFGATANTINLDGREYIGLDATKIYLGSDALEFELEPVIKGDALEVVLQDLFQVILGIGKQMTTASSLSGGPVLNLNVEGPTVVKEMQRLKSLINPGGKSYIKSKKVFTE